MDSSDLHIIIADKQYLIARSLAELAEKNLHFKVREIVSSRDDLERSLASGPISLLIIDVFQFEFDRVSDLRKILSVNSSVPILVLTNSLTREELTDLNSIGVKNILLKTAGVEELLTAIDHALRSKKYYGPEVMDMIMDASEWKRIPHDNSSLTGAEIEIVKLIAEGMTTKEIASRKHVSFHTIMTHRKNIFRKTKVNNASELVMHAIRTGIIDTIEYQI
jgi:DNA-binding NarL/FixJ family response regulator